MACMKDTDCPASGKACGGDVCSWATATHACVLAESGDPLVAAGLGTIDDGAVVGDQEAMRAGRELRGNATDLDVAGQASAHRGQLVRRGVGHGTLRQQADLGEAVGEQETLHQFQERLVLVELRLEV